MDKVNATMMCDDSSDIVITGFSGRLPESSNIKEFRDNLFNGVDMVNDDPRRWPKGLYDLPPRFGKIKDCDLEQFDQQFFSVHQKQAECMDPQMRMLLESVYEAIIDAGFNPQDLRGSRTGVYVGASYSEVEEYWNADPDRVNGYGMTGCARAMFANRVSFSFDFKGPSIATDTASSSSMHALSLAFEDMRSGRCDSAIVGGTGLILKPTMSLQFKRFGMLSHDGKCKAFDESGCGFVRSDGCVALFLQKASKARRVYASVLNVRTNSDGFTEQGITFPDGQMQNRLIRETYESIGLNPANVVYVEAHGTGTKAGDPQEVNSITDFFCNDRHTPLLVGSVKSNMGHSESASGTCAIAKVLIAMEEGIIPGNLHYQTPNAELHGILDGRIQVVDRNLPWKGGIIGINSFGFGGSNAHVILQSNPKRKQLPKEPQLVLPRLVCVSGRTTEAVELLLKEAKNNKDDEEFLGLVDEIHSRNIPLHYHRGYTVLGNADSVQEVFEVAEENRPIWYIYSGMGSQWATMAKDLMHVEEFSNSIRRCAEALRPEGIDLIDIITRNDERMFDNIVNSFVAIAAVQVGLTDLLAHIGIRPEGIVGHSVGELGCAYADGCFTPEQTVLAAFWRGKSIIESDLMPGTMAAVGLTWEECKEQLPEDVIPACHNSKDSVTISGPSSSVNQVIEELNKKDVFAKAVNSSGVAFHSKFIADAAPVLRKHLDRIIPNPKNRTSRWISTSLPESAWNQPIAQQSSAEYHVNNLLSPVLFQEAMHHIPKNAVCIEVAPTGLLQAILRRSLGPGVTNLSLVKRDHEDNLQFLLSNIGKLYAVGANPQISKLYRPITYPVGRGTPMLNSMVRWDHSQRFMVPKLHAESQSGESFVEVNTTKEEYAYMNGHRIDHRVLFPATGYMTLVWRTFAKLKQLVADKCPVVFEDVVFHRPTVLPKIGSVKFGISFFDGSGQFELCESGLLTVSGKINTMLADDMLQHEHNRIQTSDSTTLSENDVYKELRLRGYDYSGRFRGIYESDLLADSGRLKWDGEWISFMDTMLQFSILSIEHRELYLPTRIEKVIIDPVHHIEKMPSDNLVPVHMYKDHNIIKSGGVEIRGLITALAPRRIRTHVAPILERHSFVPYFNRQEDLSAGDAIAVSVQIALENSGGALKLKVADVVASKTVENIMAPHIQYYIESEPTLVTDVTIFTDGSAAPYVERFSDTGIRVTGKDATKGPVDQNCNIVTGYDVTQHADAKQILQNLRSSIKDNGFILLEESLNDFNEETSSLLFANLHLTKVSVQLTSHKMYILLRPEIDFNDRNKSIVFVTEKSFDWLSNLKDALAASELSNELVYVVCMGEADFGGIGFMNCLKLEPRGQNARLVFVQDRNVAQFSFDDKIFKDQLNKDLLMNVYRNGEWGSYRHLQLHATPTKSAQNAYVSVVNKGELSSINWFEGPPHHSDLDSDYCSVYYAPINLRDLMLSSVQLGSDVPADLATAECNLGVEFAGRNSKGKRIMSMVRAKALATTCAASSFTWEIPDNWSMEQASTIPYAYSTVYYALVIRGQIRQGESILIHSGTSAIGLAAISVALQHGLTVYTTVGGQDKQDFLKDMFHQLENVHVSAPSGASFEQYVMHNTQGKGVNLVLNSLADKDTQLASIRCLAVNGRFLEVENIEPNQNHLPGRSMFLKNNSFHGIHMDSLINGDADTIQQVVRLIADGIRSGAVRPLPTQVFSYKQLEDAFRLKTSRKHIGKVVIKIRDEESTNIVDPVEIRPTLMTCIPRLYMQKEKSYILIGGLGGIGLELTNWLINRGATKIVLNSRSGIKTGYQASMIHRWTQQGVDIVIDTSDITTLFGTEAIIAKANALGPVGGIFNLAAVLVNEMFENLSADDFIHVCGPKVAGTKNLDAISRKLCKDLDYFVCFSSMSSGRGNVGQSNYGLANSVMERICESRQADALPATALQFGAIADAGIIVDNYGDNEVVIAGTLPQRMACCLQTMDTFMQQLYGVQSSMVVTEKHKEDTASVSLVKCVANILGVKDMKNVPDQTSLADLGMDSLMSAEMKPMLEQNYNVVLGFNEIRLLTFGKLKALDTENNSEADTLDTTRMTRL